MLLRSSPHASGRPPAGGLQERASRFCEICGYLSRLARLIPMSVCCPAQHACIARIRSNPSWHPWRWRRSRLRCRRRRFSWLDGRNMWGGTSTNKTCVNQDGGVGLFPQGSGISRAIGTLKQLARSARSHAHVCWHSRLQRMPWRGVGVCLRNAIERPWSSAIALFALVCELGTGDSYGFKRRSACIECSTRCPICSL